MAVAFLAILAPRWALLPFIRAKVSNLTDSVNMKSNSPAYILLFGHFAFLFVAGVTIILAPELVLPRRMIDPAGTTDGQQIMGFALIGIALFKFVQILGKHESVIEVGHEEFRFRQAGMRERKCNWAEVEEIAVVGSRRTYLEVRFIRQGGLSLKRLIWVPQFVFPHLCPREWNQVFSDVPVSVKTPKFGREYRNYVKRVH